MLLFFLDMFLTLSVIQSTSFFLGKGDRFQLAVWMDVLKEGHSSSVEWTGTARGGVVSVIGLCERCTI